METVIVGERGQITIPKKLRERFGIKSKSPVVFELREDGIMIRPAVTVTVREFSESFIKDVTKADELKAGEKREYSRQMEKKIKVFLDSNVLFSIAFTGKEKSRSFLTYEIQALGILRVYISNLVCEEALSNIRRKKTDAEELLNELITSSKVLEDIVSHLSNPLLGKLPQNDQIILSTAVYHKMDVFVTGNENHFKHLYRKKILDTLILKPVEFLKMEF